ncbi:hypothetical protein BC830DRAFT_1097787 [Chytriomyces sp. MP71]|nr:hypothetical protein BC830DRAFT_1097787 [Chytriomyces sp. MP71]
MENTSSSPLLDRTTASTSVTQVPMSDQTNLSAPAPGGTDAHKGTRFDPVASTPKPPAPYSNPECEPSQDDSESTRGNPAEVGEFGAVNSENSNVLLKLQTIRRRSVQPNQIRASLNP